VIAVKPGDDPRLFREAFSAHHVVVGATRNMNHPKTWIVVFPQDTTILKDPEAFRKIFFRNAHTSSGDTNPELAWGDRTHWLIDTSEILDPTARLYATLHASDMGPRKATLMTDAFTAQSALMAPYVAEALTPYQWGVCDVASFLLHVAARYGDEKEQRAARRMASDISWRRLHNGAVPHPSVVQEFAQSAAGVWVIPDPILYDPKAAEDFISAFWGRTTGVSTSILGSSFRETFGGNPNAIVEAMRFLAAAPGAKHEQSAVRFAHLAAGKVYRQRASRFREVRLLLDALEEGGFLGGQPGSALATRSSVARYLQNSGVLEDVRMGLSDTLLYLECMGIGRFLQTPTRSWSPASWTAI
jgi:hypothetical protein